MKRFLLVSAIMLALTGYVWGEGDVANWSGTFSLATTDTAYIPSETHAFNTEDYIAWGFKYYIITPDTIDADTVCWILEVSDTKQCSNTVVMATDTSVNDASVDTFAYWFRADSISGAVFPEEHWRLTLLVWKQTASAGDTIYPDSDVVVLGWEGSAAESSWKALDDALGSEDTTTAGGYAYAESLDCDHDSMLAVNVEAIGNTGWADSVVVFVLHVEEDTALACSVEVAICHVDTGTCTVLDTVICNNDTARTTMVSTTSPSSGESWTDEELKDLVLRFIPIYVSTNDKAKICQAGVIVYANDTYYREAVGWKARAVGKE